MSDASRRVLDLLAQGKVTVDEASELLKALRESEPDGPAPASDSRSSERPRYIRIAVRKNPRAGEDDGRAYAWPSCMGPGRHSAKEVNIKVPMALVKNGMRLGAFVPGGAELITQVLRDRGIHGDLSKITPDQLEALLKEMGELTVDVDHGRAQVRITAE